MYTEDMLMETELNVSLFLQHRQKLYITDHTPAVPNNAHKRGPDFDNNFLDVEEWPTFGTMLHSFSLLKLPNRLTYACRKRGNISLCIHKI